MNRSTPSSRAKRKPVLQLCLYADLLADMQGLPPEYVHVMAPWSEFKPQQFRFADYAAYFPEGKTCARCRRGRLGQR